MKIKFLQLFFSVWLVRQLEFSIAQLNSMTWCFQSFFPPPALLSPWIWNPLAEKSRKSLLLSQLQLSAWLQSSPKFVEALNVVLTVYFNYSLGVFIHCGLKQLKLNWSFTGEKLPLLILTYSCAFHFSWPFHGLGPGHMRVSGLHVVCCSLPPALSPSPLWTSAWLVLTAVIGTDHSPPLFQWLTSLFSVPLTFSRSEPTLDPGLPCSCLQHLDSVMLFSIISLPSDPALLWICLFSSQELQSQSIDYSIVEKLIHVAFTFLGSEGNY